MECYIHPNSIDFVDTFGTRVIQIPGGLTSVSQACNFGIIKQLKIRFVILFQGKKEAEYRRMSGTLEILVPDRVQMLQWLHKIWREFTNKIILNSFRKCVLTGEFDVDIDIALQLV